uniref:Uncharacterized protein n=1 Tax=mine drainage metagenome TaxID=410659 RepID=E6QR46_9ZZZZ
MPNFLALYIVIIGNQEQIIRVATMIRTDTG